MAYQRSFLSLCQILSLLGLALGEASSLQSSAAKGLLSNALKRLAESAERRGEATDAEQKVVATLTKSQVYEIDEAIQALKHQQREEMAIADALKRREDDLNRKAAELKLREEVAMRTRLKEAAVNHPEVEKNHTQSQRKNATTLSENAKQKHSQAQRKVNDTLNHQEAEQNHPWVQKTDDKVLKRQEGEHKDLQSHGREDEITSVEEAAQEINRKATQLRATEGRMQEVQKQDDPLAGKVSTQKVPEHHFAPSTDAALSTKAKKKDEALSTVEHVALEVKQKAQELKSVAHAALQVQESKDQLLSQKPPSGIVQQKTHELVAAQRQAAVSAQKKENIAALKLHIEQLQKMLADQQAAEQFINEVEHAKNNITFLTMTETAARNTDASVVSLAPVKNGLKAMAQAREDLGKTLEQNDLKLQSAQFEKMQAQRKAAERYTAEIQKKNNELQAVKDNVTEFKKQERQFKAIEHHVVQVQQEKMDELKLKAKELRMMAHGFAAGQAKDAATQEPMANALGALASHTTGSVQGLPQAEVHAQTNKSDEPAAQRLHSLNLPSPPVNITQVMQQPQSKGVAQPSAEIKQSTKLSLLSESEVEARSPIQAKAQESRSFMSAVTDFLWGSQADLAQKSYLMDSTGNAVSQEKPRNHFLTRTWQPHSLPYVQDPPHLQQPSMAEIQVETLAHKQDEHQRLRQMQDAMMADGWA